MFYSKLGGLEIHDAFNIFDHNIDPGLTNWLDLPCSATQVVQELFANCIINNQVAFTIFIQRIVSSRERESQP